MKKIIVTDFEDTLAETNYIPTIYPKFIGNTEFIKQHNKLVKKYYNIEKINDICSENSERLLHQAFYEELRYIMNNKSINMDINKLIDWRMNKLSFTLNPKAKQFLDQAMEKSYDIAILTNSLPSRRNEINKTLKHYNIMDILLSCEIGYYKPQLNMYRYVIEKFHGLGYYKIVYLDDIEDFIFAAKKAGIKESYLISNNIYPKI